MLSGNTSLDLELNHFFGCERINSSRTRDFLIVAGLFFAASCKRGEITWYYCSTSCFVLFRCVVDGTDGRPFFSVCFFVLLVGGRGRVIDVGMGSRGGSSATRAVDAGRMINTTAALRSGLRQ